MFFLPDYKSSSLTMPDGATIPFVTIGSGEIPVLLIPGAGGGLSTVESAAPQLAWLYRQRADRYHTIVVNRRVPFPRGFDVERQADDFLWLMEQMDVPWAIVECNSAGGPVGQWMAVKQPERVRALVLASTLHRADATVRAKFEQWMQWLDEGNWQAFTWDSLEVSFVRRIRLYRLFRPLLGLFKPSDPERAKRVLQVLLDLDNSALLPYIQQPTLVIAGEEDPICTAPLQREMADLLPNSRLVLCPGYKHGNDIENPAYRSIFDEFVQEVVS